MRLADGGWVFDPVCTSGVFFYFYFFAQRLTTVKHAFGVECRPGRSVFSYDCIKVSLGPNIPMYDKKNK